MCDCQPTNRRDLLVGAALAVPALAVPVLALAASGAQAAPVAPAAPSAPTVPSVPAVEVMPGLSILPRDAWGADLPPKGPLRREDPKFLLVHHTASPNNYRDARSVIRTVYRWHTSNDPTKRFPDVAYEFFVGRDGDVWEGRAGSLAGPVMASATGGSQGWAQLVCLLGDFTSVMPTAAAQDALVKVLAWTADRYGIDTSPGATVSFVSRGSQRHRPGAVVTAPTIVPHREMSYTSCPGDAFAPKVTDLMERVHAQRAEWASVIKPAVRLGVVSP